MSRRAEEVCEGLSREGLCGKLMLCSRASFSWFGCMYLMCFVIGRAGTSRGKLTCLASYGLQDAVLLYLFAKQKQVKV